MRFPQGRRWVPLHHRQQRYGYCTYVHYDRGFGDVHAADLVGVFPFLTVDDSERVSLFVSQWRCKCVLSRGTTFRSATRLPKAVVLGAIGCMNVACFFVCGVRITALLLIVLYNMAAPRSQGHRWDTHRNLKRLIALRR